MVNVMLFLERNNVIFIDVFEEKMNIRKRKVEFVVVKKFSSKFVKLDLVLSFLVVVLLLKDWGFDCRFIVVVL